eukprot:537115-Pyramimonas_sp.AAC.1
MVKTHGIAIRVCVLRGAPRETRSLAGELRRLRHHMTGFLPTPWLRFVELRVLHFVDTAGPPMFHQMPSRVA